MRTVERIHPLTARQVEVVLLYGDGLSYADICAQTGLAWRTVRNHLHTARQRLRVHTSAQAAQVLKKRMRNAESQARA
jgi:DNA-binding NarL/FixJ family response regulator